MSIIKINGETQFQQEIDKGGLQIIKFGAAWCQPCKVIDKTLEEIQSEISENILKIDVDVDGEIAGQFDVMSIPTVVFVKDKVIKSHMVGIKSKEELKQAIEAIKGEI